jgi:hypothetical protein
LGDIDGAIGHSIQFGKVVSTKEMVGSSRTSGEFSTKLFGGWCSRPLQLSSSQSQPIFSSNIFSQTNCAVGCRGIGDTKPALQAYNFLSRCDFLSRTVCNFDVGGTSW